jgi:guanosine-3',5'-bis(diphosphate) 3'-pyrophosphohydrolase
VKLGDKISNVRYVAHYPPESWSVERRRQYLDWTEQVIAGLRGVNPALEARYDEALAEARKVVG